MTYLASAALSVVFYAALLGTTIFATVLGARAWDAHDRGITRVRRTRP